MADDLIVEGREIRMTRLLSAPRELVWDVWTKEEHVKNWWGPNGFTQTYYEMDVRPGGIARFMMHGPDGRDYPNKIIFIDVKKPELLSYKHTDDGNEEIRFHVRIEFEAQGKKTLMKWRMLFDDVKVLERVSREFGAIEGAKQHVAKLEEYLIKIQQ